MSMIQFLLGPLPPVPRSVFLLDWGTTIVVFGGARSLVRGFREAALVALRIAGPGARAHRRRGGDGSCRCCA